MCAAAASWRGMRRDVEFPPFSPVSPSSLSPLPDPSLPSSPSGVLSHHSTQSISPIVKFNKNLSGDACAPPTPFARRLPQSLPSLSSFVSRNDGAEGWCCGFGTIPTFMLPLFFAQFSLSLCPFEATRDT